MINLASGHGFGISVNRIKIIAYFLPVLALFYVYKFGVNVLFFDEFSFVDFFRDDLDFSKFIFEPHNEHFMPLGKLEYYLIAKLTAMNSKAFMYVNVLVLWLPYALFIRKIKTESPFIAIISIVVFYLAFYSPLSRENLLWGFQTLFLSAYSFAVLAILLCDSYIRTRAVKYLFLASVCCCIASLNSSHGILSWLSVFMAMLYRRQYKNYLLPLFPMLIIVVFYLAERSGVVFQSRQDLGDLSFVQIAGFLLTFISSSMWNFCFEISWAIGLLVFCLLAYLIVLKKYYKSYLVTTLFVFGVLLAAMVTFGRWRFGILYSYQSRYLQLQMPLYLALTVALSYYRYTADSNKIRVLLMGRHNNVLFASNGGMFAAVTVALAFMLVFLSVSVSKIKDAEWWHGYLANNFATIRTFEAQPRSVIETGIHSNYDDTVGKLRVLKSQKLNAFSAGRSNMPDLPFAKVSAAGSDLGSQVQNAKFYIEQLSFSLDYGFFFLDIAGWCFDENEPSANGKWSLVLQTSDRFYQIPLNSVDRPDVSEAFHHDLVKSGFTFRGFFSFDDNSEIKFPIKFYLVNESDKGKKLFDINKTVTGNN